MIDYSKELLIEIVRSQQTVYRETQAKDTDFRAELDPIDIRHGAPYTDVGQASEEARSCGCVSRITGKSFSDTEADQSLIGTGRITKSAE